MVYNRCMQPMITENLITVEQCKKLIDYFNFYKKNIETMAEPVMHNARAHLWGGERTLGNISDPEVKSIVNSVLEFIEDKEKSTFDLSGELVFLRLFAQKMTEGGEVPSHTDNTDDFRSKERPRRENENYYSTLLYLSDDYEGGELLFPNLDIEMKPKAGTLVSFLGNEDFLHGVNPVISGERYNIVIFYIIGPSTKTAAL
jgi:predicted 2-oxoglutarate/Fe(II)-dependent dioxygenase YbiX